MALPASVLIVRFHKTIYNVLIFLNTQIYHLLFYSKICQICVAIFASIDNFEMHSDIFALSFASLNPHIFVYIRWPHTVCYIRRINVYLYTTHLCSRRQHSIYFEQLNCTLNAHTLVDPSPSPQVSSYILLMLYGYQQ